MELWYASISFGCVFATMSGIDPKVLVKESGKGITACVACANAPDVIGGKFSVWSAVDAGTEVELAHRGVARLRQSSSSRETGWMMCTAARTIGATRDHR